MDNRFPEDYVARGVNNRIVCLHLCLFIGFHSESFLQLFHVAPNDPIEGAKNLGPQPARVGVRLTFDSTETDGCVASGEDVTGGACANGLHGSTRASICRAVVLIVCFEGRIGTSTAVASVTNCSVSSSVVVVDSDRSNLVVAGSEGVAVRFVPGIWSDCRKQVTGLTGQTV